MGQAYYSSQQQQQKYHKSGAGAAPAAPVNTVAPVASGTATTGSTLTSTAGTWTGSPAPTFGYQWQRAGVDIGGATSGTYVLVTADEAQAITCVVTGTNASGSATGTSNTITPAVTAPANSVLPLITTDGSPATGETITCSSGTWSGSPTYAYQWKRATVDIGGETTSSHVLVTADEAQAITCAVTATNAGGAVSATSLGVTPATAYQLAVAADSPVAWWHLGDAAGTAVDSIAGRNGTYTNSPPGFASLVARGDGSHDFNGTTQYVALPDSATLRPANVTVEAWVNVDAYTASDRIITLAGSRFWMGIDATGHLVVLFYNGATNRSVTSTGAMTAGVTYHVAGTFNTTTKVLTATINGVVDGQTTFAAESISWAAGVGAIGSDQTGAGASDLNGRIDEAAVYSTALSTARLLAHYNAGI